MKNKIKKIALFFSLFSPVVVFGADMSTIGGILEWATTLLKDTILPLLISVGVVFFIYGVVRFYLAPSNEKEKEKYRKVADLIRIWEQEDEQNADKNWEEFEKELEKNKIEIHSIK